MKLPPLPTRIKVGPHVYRVVLKPARLMPKGPNGHDEGACRFNELEIWLKKGMRRSKTQENAWHETKHACTYPDLIGKTATDEEFIEPTAPRELAVLQENPELVAYLTSGPPLRKP